MSGRVLGFYHDPGRGLAVLSTPDFGFPGGAPQITYDQYDANLQSVSKLKVLLQTGMVWGARAFVETPGAWSALAHKLLDEQAHPHHWVMSRTQRQSMEFIALIGEQPDQGGRIVISGVSMGGGRFCLRSRRYDHMLKDLGTWVDGQAGQSANGISQAAFDALSKSTDGTILLSALSDPHISNDAYRINPILWMGDPNKPENCQWDASRD